MAQTATYDELRQLIAPYRIRKTIQEPPFSTAEIVAIALLSTITRSKAGQADATSSPLCLSLLITYIISTFAWFAKLVTDDNLESRGTLTNSIVDALRQYDLPVIVSNSGNTHTNSIRSDHRYSMTWRDGIFFLRNYFPAKLVYPPSLATLPFHFLKLPAELKHMIYEMLLCFPDSGIRIDCSPTAVTGSIASKQKKHRVSVMSRYLHQHISFGEWESAANNHNLWREYPFYLASLSQLLDKFIVNKEIHTDAQKTFYSKNRFHCLDIVALRRFLEIIPDGCRDLLRHVSFAYPIIQRFQAPSVIQLLKKTEMPLLKKLTIHINKDAIDAYKKQDGSLTYAELGKYPGFQRLGRLELTEVEFEGDGCEEIAAHFKKVTKWTRIAANGVDVE